MLIKTLNSNETTVDAWAGRTRGHVQGAARGNAEQWTWAAKELGGHDEKVETRRVRVLAAT